MLLLFQSCNIYFAYLLHIAAITNVLAAVKTIRFGENFLGKTPVHLGGLGVRMGNDIALPAFISSLHTVQELVDEAVSFGCGGRIG